MPGFAFWGLFAVLALIVVGYLAWMLLAERAADADTDE
jgi:hypothetical protein